MAATIATLTQRPPRKALEDHYPKARELHLRKLISDDPKRGASDRPGNHLPTKHYVDSGPQAGFLRHLQEDFHRLVVELGKVLAQRIIPERESQTEPQLKHNNSTSTLIRRCRKLSRSNDR